MVNYLLKPVKAELVVFLKGLVRIWKKFLAGLPEPACQRKTK